MSKYAKALFKFLKGKTKNEKFTLKDMSEASGYKEGSMRTKKNHCLKNVYITEFRNSTFRVKYDKIQNSNEEEFLKQISEKKENTKEKSLEDYLIENSQAFILSAIELHNKPNFPYRYEIATILIISAWEKLFKAHILKLNNDRKKIEKTTIDTLINILKQYPVKNNDVLPCNKLQPIKNIKTVGKSISAIKDYRNQIVHFYEETKSHSVILNLIFKNIFLYCDYLKNNFNIDIRKENDLFLLPIGLENHEWSFKKIIDENHNNPLFNDYISKIKKYVKQLNGEESIFIDFNYSIGEKGEHTTKFILSKEGQKITLSEEDIKRLYPYNFEGLNAKLKKQISNFKQNQEYYKIRNQIRGDINGFNQAFAHYRKFNPLKEKSGGTWLYNDEMVKEIIEEYKKTKNSGEKK